MSIVGLTILIITEVLEAFKFAVSLINVAQFPPGDPEVIQKVQFKDLEYYERVKPEPAGFYFYWVNLIIGPDKAGLVGDLLAVIAFAMCQRWGYLSFFALMLIPALGVEYGFFSAEPQNNLPMLAWAKLFGIEGDEIYNNEQQTTETINDNGAFY